MCGGIEDVEKERGSTGQGELTWRSPFEVAVVSAERSTLEWDGQERRRRRHPKVTWGFLRGHEPMLALLVEAPLADRARRRQQDLSWRYTAGSSRWTAIKSTSSPRRRSWQRTLISNAPKRLLGELKLRLTHQIFPRSVVLRPGSRLLVTAREYRS